MEESVYSINDPVQENEIEQLISSFITEVVYYLFEKNNGNVTQDPQTSIPMVPYEELSEGGNQTSLLHPIPVTIRTNGYHTIHEAKKVKSNEKLGVLDNLKHYIMIFKNATQKLA